MRAADTERSSFGAVEHPSGITHDGLFISSAAEWLYVATYSPKTDPLGCVVFCPSWGVEAGHQLAWSHRLAHDAAAAGAATAVIQWPGTEDSEGDAAELTLDRLVEAAVDIEAAMRARTGTGGVYFAGLRVGATPALLAAAEVGGRVVLIQPVLDLPAHFAGAERAARRARLHAGTGSDWAFGQPLPRGLRRDENRDRVQKVIDEFHGSGAVVGYRRPTMEFVPNSLQRIRVWGEWTASPMFDHGRLQAAATRWLARSLRGRG